MADAESEFVRPRADKQGRRHFLRAAVASKTVVEVGEPVQLALKLLRSTPEGVVASIGGTRGARRYVAFDSPGTHRVPVAVTHRDGRRDEASIEFEVRAPAGPQPYPVLRVRQEPLNPFVLDCGLKNAAVVHRTGMRYEWRIDTLGTFGLREPFFVLDTERLLNTTNVDIPFDLHFAAIYPDGTRRETAESYRLFNDYAWFKERGVLKPRVLYDFRVQPAARTLHAQCVIVNDENEPIELVARQFEVLFDDADRVIVPEPASSFAMTIEPQGRGVIDCSIPRHKLPSEAFGFAFHLHGRTSSGLKVEASAYFEHYTYRRQWSQVRNLDAQELLGRAKAALSQDTSRRPEGVFVGLASAGAAEISAAGLSNYVEAMRPVWSAADRERFDRALDDVLRVPPERFGMQIMGGDGDAFFLGQSCLQDEEPPSAELACKLTGTRGQVYVPSRIVNAKKGDVILAPGGPLGFIGGLLQQVKPPQHYSHSGLMTSNFYRLRHSTASDEWIQDEVYGRTLLDPDAVGTEGVSPQSLKYIWPGTVDQTVEQAFLGSWFAYKSADGKREKAYKIGAFSKSPEYFEGEHREIAFPLVVKPDPLLEGDPAFAHLRKTLSRVAEKAKTIVGHYRFYCYSDGAISRTNDVAHRAPDLGPGWWASGSRATVCSTLIFAAIDDLSSDPDPLDVQIEGKRAMLEVADLERPGADDKADVDRDTRDGLYLYSSQERKDAADWLYQRVYGDVLAKSGDLGRLFTDAPDDFANQICNAFAFDYTGREFDGEDAKDSDKWKSPGVGRTVSPDDILRFWDRPVSAPNGEVRGLYGSAQRMVFRDSVFEERELGTWVRREHLGKLAVEVKYRGQPMAGADVKVGGQVGVTDARGKVTIELPEGKYEVSVAAMRGEQFFEGKAPAQVLDKQTTPVSIDLPDPPEFARILIIGGSIRIMDEETFGKNEILNEAISVRPMYLDPNRRYVTESYSRKWGGEIRVEARFDCTWNADLSITVAYDVKLFEGTSEDTGDLDGQKGSVVVIAKDAKLVPLSVYVRNEAEDDDDYVRLTLQLTNAIDMK